MDATTKSFSATVQTLSLSVSGYVAGADVNGDGYGDIVFAAGPAGWVFTGSALGISTTPTQSFSLPTGRNGRVFSAGDMNGDGFDDVVVTRPNALSGAGLAYLCMGNSTAQLTPSYCRRIAGFAAPAGLGVAVAAGDINRDGYSDIAIERADGNVSVYAGSSDTVSTPVAWATLVIGSRTVTGRDLAVGDVDGDGYDDVVVGVYQGSGVDGAVQVWFGRYPGLNGYQNIEYPWAPASAGGFCGDGGSMGYSVGVPGDVDGDGYEDIVAGAPYDLNMCGGGYAYLFYGDSSGAGESTWSEWTGYDITGWAASIGLQSSGRADYNGDFYADVTLGDDVVAYANGAAAGFALTDASTETINGGTTVVDVAPEPVPRWAPVGDLNGDGRDELLVFRTNGGSTLMDVYFGAP